ncbi:MAG: hypothetical protein ABIG71_04570 [Candidatus Uhrbacteria bacterium]
MSHITQSVLNYPFQCYYESMERMAFNRDLVRLTHPIFARPLSRWCVLSAAMLLIGAWVATFAVPNAESGAIVVHYTTTFGIDALGSWRDLLRLPITGSILVVLDVVLAFLLTERDEQAPTPASWILVIAALLIAFVVCFGTLLLLRMNLLFEG